VPAQLGSNCNITPAHLESARNQRADFTATRFIHSEERTWIRQQ